MVGRLEPGRWDADPAPVLRRSMCGRVTPGSIVRPSLRCGESAGVAPDSEKRGSCLQKPEQGLVAHRVKRACLGHIHAQPGRKPPNTQAAREPKMQDCPFVRRCTRNTRVWLSRTRDTAKY